MTDLEVLNDYESIKIRAVALRKSSDGNDWRLGHLCLELELLGEATGRAKEPKDLLKKLAQDTGYSYGALAIRAKISRRIKEDDEVLGWIRESSLTYAHVRELY